jgi:hypothetical protein
MSVKSVVIPAKDGFKLGVFLEKNDLEPSAFAYEDVIAWRIDLHSEGEDTDDVYTRVFPIVLDWEPSLCNQWIIKTPDGKFVIPRDSTFETEEGVISFLEKALLDK